MARVIVNDNGMSNMQTTFGLDVDFYPSFLDEKKENFSYEREDSYGFSAEHACHGLFTELGFSEDIPAPKWSLAEQFGLIPVDNPSLEEIVDEACSPLSVTSVDSDVSNGTSDQNSFFENPSFQDILDEACSSLSPLSSDASAANDSGVPSPFTDSGVSSPACSPASGLEVLNHGLWEEDKTVETLDWSTFSFIPDNYLNTELNNSENVDTGNTAQLELGMGNQEADTIEQTPVMHQIQAPVIEKVMESVDNVVNTEQIVPALPVPSGSGKIVVLKALSVRTVPYRKPRQEKKQKTKEQKERKKNQNRDAALRYRNKKKDELNDLFDEATVLEDSNKKLTDKVTELQKEIDYLKNLMLDVIKARLAKIQNKS